jgi:hypothetical protein
VVANGVVALDWVFVALSVVAVAIAAMIVLRRREVTFRN